MLYLIIYLVIGYLVTIFDSLLFIKLYNEASLLDTFEMDQNCRFYKNAHGKDCAVWQLMGILRIIIWPSYPIYHLYALIKRKFN